MSPACDVLVYFMIAESTSIGVRGALHQALLKRGIDPIPRDPWYYPTARQYELVRFIVLRLLTIATERSWDDAAGHWSVSQTNSVTDWITRVAKDVCSKYVSSWPGSEIM